MIPSLDTLKYRNTMMKAVRQFFEENDYLEVETPTLVAMPGTEVHLEYFATNWQNLSRADVAASLRSSPELHMKRLFARYPQKLFQVGKVFRNGGELGAWHHPEFTMLEWYQPDATLETMQAVCESLTIFVWEQLNTKGYKTISRPTFHRMTVHEAFQRFAGIELVDKDPRLGEKAADLGLPSVGPTDDFDAAYGKILLEVVEPALKQLGSFVTMTNYPASQAALATIVGNYAQRLELYGDGIELANGFCELACPQENRKRLEQSCQERRNLNLPEVPIDEAFLRDIKEYHGLKESAIGVALGVDRLAGVLSGKKDLDELIPFRTDWPYSKRIGT